MSLMSVWDMRHFHFQLKCLLSCSRRGNYCSFSLCHHGLVLSILELHRHWITQSVFFCVGLLSLSVVFWDWFCCWLYQSLVRFYCWVAFHNVKMPQNLEPLSSGGALGCLQFLAALNTVAVNTPDPSSCGHASCSSAPSSHPLPLE